MQARLLRQAHHTLSGLIKEIEDAGHPEFDKKGE